MIRQPNERSVANNVMSTLKWLFVILWANLFSCPILHYSISTGKSQPFITKRRMARNHKQSNLSYLASCLDLIPNNQCPEASVPIDTGYYSCMCVRHLDVIYYYPPMKLREGNVFSRACHVILSVDSYRSHGDPQPNPNHMGTFNIQGPSLPPGTVWKAGGWPSTERPFCYSLKYIYRAKAMSFILGKFNLSFTSRTGKRQRKIRFRFRFPSV